MVTTVAYPSDVPLPSASRYEISKDAGVIQSPLSALPYQSLVTRDRPTLYRLRWDCLTQIEARKLRQFDLDALVQGRKFFSMPVLTENGFNKTRTNLFDLSQKFDERWTSANVSFIAEENFFGDTVVARYIDNTVSIRNVARATGTYTAGQRFYMTAYVRMFDGFAPVFSSATANAAGNTMGMVIQGASPSAIPTVELFDDQLNIYKVVAYKDIATTSNSFSGVYKYAANDARAFDLQAMQLEIGEPTDYIRNDGKVRTVGAPVPLRFVQRPRMVQVNGNVWSYEAVVEQRT